MRCNVLLFCRKNCIFSKKLFLFLRKKFKKVKVIYLEINEKPKKLNLKKIEVDLIFSFRSTYILKKNLIKKAKIASINFHPGPPEYRGIGCLNYAIFKNSKFYGVTAHLISPKIDKGGIIDVKKFKISRKISLNKLLDKTHTSSFIQAKKVINQIYKDKNCIYRFLNENKKFKWSKLLITRKYLNNFYKINKHISKKNLDNKLRATVYKGFRPYILLHGKKFEYKI